MSLNGFPLPPLQSQMYPQAYGSMQGYGTMGGSPMTDPTMQFGSGVYGLNPSTQAAAAAAGQSLSPLTDVAGAGTGMGGATGLAAGGGGSWWDGAKGFFGGAVGTREQPGWGGLALGGASALGNLFLGMKQYGLAKDSLNFQKESFNKNWDAQAKLTNSQLADRQAVRAGGSPGHASVEDYMKRYGV